jgi:1-acyl-sn-glycerol-3-phosphate acyltransferase
MKIVFYFRQILILIIILLIVLQHLIFSPKISIIFFSVLMNLLSSVLNAKIRVHGNTDTFNNNNLLVMANHYDGIIDSAILYNLHYKYNSINKIYGIVKADFLGNSQDKNIFYELMIYLRESFIKSFRLITYKRGDKDDGSIVKNKIKECLINDKNVFIFPEGVAHRNGVPVSFKQGIFDLAVENKMHILPITIKYNRDIGAEKWEPPNTKMIFDNEVDIYIHDVIRDTDECYKANDPVALKQKVFNIISAPMGVTPRSGEN